MLDPRVYTFLLLAECKSTVRCAELRHLTQPAVTQHIRALEQRYGVKLFVKEGRHLVLTEEGRKFQRLCGRICAFDEQITFEMRRGEWPMVRFGATLSICESLIPRLMPGLMEQFGGVRFHMEQQNTKVLLERLDRGELDFVLVEGNFEHQAYDYRPFFESAFVGLCSRESPFARCRRLEEVLGATLLLREKGSGTREIFEHECRAQNLTVEDFADVCEIAHIPTLMQLVAAGKGITFAYRAAALGLLEAGNLKMIPLEDFQLSRAFHFVSLQGNPHSALLEEIFAALCHGAASIGKAMRRKNTAKRR